MQPTVMVIGAGAMGSAVGRRLAEQGCKVLSPLAGRSEASLARAKAAGLIAAERCAKPPKPNSCCRSFRPAKRSRPPQRFAPILAGAAKKPIYVDCNAISPPTMAKVADALAATGCDIRRCRHHRRPAARGLQGPDLLRLRVRAHPISPISAASTA